MVILQPEDTGILISIGGDVLGDATGGSPGGSDDQIAPTSMGGGGLEAVKQKVMNLSSSMMGMMMAVASLSMLAFRFTWQVQRSQIAGAMLENAQLRSQTARENYQKAVDKYGANSEQAVKASREVTIAQDNVQRSHTRAEMAQQRQWFQILPAALGGLNTSMALLQQGQQIQQSAHSLGKFADTEQQKRDTAQLTQRSTRLAANIAKYIPAVGIAAFVIGEGITFAEMADDQQAQKDAQNQLNQMMASPDMQSSGITTTTKSVTVNVLPGMNEKAVAEQAWSQIRSA